MNLVILKGKEYFYEIDWETTDNLDNKMEKLNFTACKNELVSSIQNLEAKILNDWPLHRIKSIKTILGSAMAHCLSLDEGNARKLLSEAEDLLKIYYKDIVRYWSLLYSSWALLFFVTITLITLAWIEKINHFYNTNVLPYVLAIFLGIVGAFFSICLHIGNVDYSSKTGKDIVMLETICRLLVGGISGLIIVLMVMSGIILPKLQDEQSLLSVSLVFAFAGGSCERLVPSIITHMRKPYSSEGEQNGH